MEARKSTWCFTGYILIDFRPSQKGTVWMAIWTSFWLFGGSRGVFGGAFGPLWSVLEGPWKPENRFERFSPRRVRLLGSFFAILGVSWGVLGCFWQPFGASCGPLRGFLDRLVWLLEGLGASSRHLVRDFQTKKWLHVSLASEMPFFNGFLLDFSSNFDVQIYEKNDSRRGKTYKSNKIAFRS